MSFLLIPNETESQATTIWIGVINENLSPRTLSLRRQPSGQIVSLNQNWTNYTTSSGRNSLNYQYLRIDGLDPRTEYVFELLDGTDVLSACTVRTLPASLPNLDERPFTVLLGSCFCAPRAGSEALGTAHLKLWEKEKIDVKILCGDQVYLDYPALHFLFNTHSFKDLEEMLLDNYVKTWTQGRSINSTAQKLSSGYQAFLQTGANFFSSDDHEFYNNAPNKASLIRDSWSKTGRQNWMTIARNLLEAFQTKKTRTVFNVGSLSFFIADTRINRTQSRTNFMSPADLTALDNWVSTLQGIGVLVVGQPIFSSEAGFLSGRFGDWNLSNYEQYKDLVRVLMKTEHSIIVLTGDVHYGRIASCQLKPGVSLYEIISSPTALVDPKVGGSWKKAPDKFPAFGVPGVVSKPVVNVNYKWTENHFLLLNFYQFGSKTKLVVEACEIFAGGKNPTPIKIAEINLS